MVVVSDKKQYFINKLPNDALTFILSKLQVVEDVRCNILSKMGRSLKASSSQRIH